MGKLADKNILITGGNSGIGLATAQEFAREGARVAICGLNQKTLQAAKEALGAGSLAVRADVSNLADLDTMFATIKREFGHLGRHLRKRRLQRIPAVRRGDRAKLRHGDRLEFQRGLLHDSKGLAATQARLVCRHQCVRWGAQGVADDVDRLDLQGRGRPSRSNPQRRTRGPRDSREHPKPRPD
jgi:NAD(P)-dependent dehydrogenase (short-subunit alcohol dehydrogenase family)